LGEGLRVRGGEGQGAFWTVSDPGE
jgi:hypothetical protein